MKLEKITEKELSDVWLETGGISKAINVVARKVNETIDWINAHKDQLLEMPPEE